jgi:hypothetical protein
MLKALSIENLDQDKLLEECLEQKGSRLFTLL